MHKFFALLLCIIAFTACQNAEQKEHVLKVGTNAEFAPFAFIENGEIVGFDIDMAREVCKRLGYEIELTDLPFEALIPELTMGSLQFVAAGMTATEERAQRVHFSNPYIHGDPLLMVYTNVNLDPLQVESLNTLNVVVNEGYTADLFLSERLSAPLTRLPTPIDGFMALQSLRADVFVTASNTVIPFLKNNSEQHYFSQPIPGSAENCAMMISKKHHDLVSSINSCIQNMLEDGTVDRLKEKWGVL